ncbi:hypothetical protein PFISCL1PPCAC_26561 [Pristionchus fissidentatus]|uniref:Uncharacterized protein n=1 Tax=Pristionchus fissidentatus TaxID=1538716 RepID=A0AAV5WX76_9BILA|nr:hypothetical protein PFISCL1PPCAC_26561 [Pristionchus fissidentatus]
MRSLAALGILVCVGSYVNGATSERTPASAETGHDVASIADEVNEDLGTQENQLAPLSKRFDPYPYDGYPSRDDFHKRFETLDKRFDSYQKRFDGYQKRFDSYEKRLDPYQKRFDGYQKRFDPFQKRFDAYSKRFDPIRSLRLRQQHFSPIDTRAFFVALG